MKHKKILIIAALSIALGIVAPVYSAPDLIVINADVRTSDPKQNRAEAFAVKDSKFSAIGSSTMINQMVGDNTVVIDAQGKTIVPGFIDSHTHLSSGSKIVTGINLTGIREKSVWLEMIKERVKTMKAGEWLLGGRWDYTFENKGYPTRLDLDSVAPNNPVALSDIDGHSMWLNSKALELAGIKADSKVPMGGQIQLDEEGVPTGILLEGEMDLVWRDETYVRDSDAARDEIQQVIDYATSLGITSVHDMSSRIELNKYKELAADQKLNLRIFWGEHSKFSKEEDSTNQDNLIYELIDQYKINDDELGPMIEYGFIKYVIDGVLSTHTAALVDPYSDMPDTVGEPFYIQNEINRLVKRANTLGMPVAIHAIGDRGVEMALNAFEYSNHPDLANRVEHIEVVQPGTVERFEQLNVTASMQPNHGTGVIGKYITPRIGTEREQFAYVWNDFLKGGVRLALSSDFATSPFSPLVQLYDAVFRESPSGLYDGPWYPEQRISFDQALFAYTQTGADLSGWGDQIGSITNGKWADFVILDQRLSEPVGKELKETLVTSTFFAGKEVYTKN